MDVGADVLVGAGSGAITCGENLGVASLGSSVIAAAEEIGFCLPLNSEPSCLRLADATVQAVPVDSGAMYVPSRGAVSIEDRQVFFQLFFRRKVCCYFLHCLFGGISLPL